MQIQRVGRRPKLKLSGALMKEIGRSSEGIVLFFRDGQTGTEHSIILSNNDLQIIREAING